MVRQPRFRKGKKAFKAGKHNKFAVRYQRAIEKYRRQKIMAMKMAMTAMMTTASYARIAIIQNTLGRSGPDKAVAIAKELIDIAQAIPKILA